MAEGRRIGSEDEVIRRFFAPLAAGFPGAFGLIDDCAVVDVAEGEELVLTTDAVAEGVHFLPGDAPQDIAWKALAVNVSDLAGKAARPKVYLLSIAFPEAPDEVWLERFAGGLAEAQSRFGIVLAGGDTDRRPGAPLSLTVTALGIVPKGRMVRRSGARAGDRILVTGTLGDSALGLDLRRDGGLAAAWNLDRHEARHLIGRYLRPEPRLALRPPLLDFASAAMDISDGLAKDLARLCAASAVGARVRTADLPLSAPAAKVVAGDQTRMERVLAGGDDYEILATAAPAHVASFRSAAAARGLGLTEIGFVESGEGVAFVQPGGDLVRLAKTGWEHF